MTAAPTRLIRVDVSAIATREDLHRLLASAFSFPDYYGKNWDAFDECIADIELPVEIRIEGIEHLAVALPSEADLFRRCLADFVAGSPAGSVTLYVGPDALDNASA